MTWSAAIAEAYASCPPSVVELPTIEVYHSTWAAPIRLVRNRSDIVATLESDAPNNPGASVTFRAFPFQFQLPQQGEGRQELRLTIDNVSRLFMASIEGMDLSVDDPVRVIYRPYLSNDLTAPHLNPPLRLTVRGMSATLDSISLACGYADFANRRFPRLVYDRTRFPGLASRA